MITGLGMSFLQMSVVTFKGNGFLKKKSALKLKRMGRRLRRIDLILLLTGFQSKTGIQNQIYGSINGFSKLFFVELILLINLNILQKNLQFKTLLILNLIFF